VKTDLYHVPPCCDTGAASFLLLEPCWSHAEPGRSRSHFQIIHFWLFTKQDKGLGSEQEPEPQPHNLPFQNITNDTAPVLAPAPIPVFGLHYSIQYSEKIKNLYKISDFSPYRPKDGGQSHGTGFT
jgi:hypothetical protein